jgi:hypothetical protein
LTKMKIFLQRNIVEIILAFFVVLF